MATKPVSFKGFAGVRNTLPPERLQVQDLVEAVNVDIDDSGRLARRAGTVQQVAGGAHSLWANEFACLFVQSGRLLRLLPDMTTDTVAEAVTPDLRMAYIDVNERIYWSNGEQSGVLDGALSRSWGLPVPEAPTMTAIAGELAPGTYQAVLTYLREDGQESGAGISSTMTLTEAGGIRLRWLAPLDPGVTQVAIYLTEPNGNILYRLSVGPAEFTGADIRTARLSLPLDKQWLDKPPAGQCLTYHRGRIWIASGSLLYATDALGYELCDLRDYTAIDDSTIRFLAGVEHGLYVGTEQAVYFLSGDRLDDMQIKSCVSSAAVAGSAVLADGALVGSDQSLAGQDILLFATASGIHLGTVDGTVQNLTAERYRFEAGPQGAATFRITENGIHQYLLFLP